MFARKSQPNWESVPAISPCHNMLIRHPNTSPALHNMSQGQAACPSTPSSSTLFHLPAAISPFLPAHTHPAPPFTIQQPGRKEREEKAAEQKGGERMWWVISAGHRLDIQTRTETALRTEGRRPQQPSGNV